MDLEQASGGIDEDGRATGGLHELDCLVHDQLQSLLRLQGRMDYFSDLVKEVEPFITHPKSCQFILHGRFT
jgi:hypothetical protein